MAQNVPSANVKADIQANISGQVTVGNHNLQIDDVRGDVINIAPVGKHSRPHPRPSPIILRPRRLPYPLLNREKEIESAISALQSKRSVEFYGPQGTGKTALLRHLAYHSVVNTFPDGVIYLSARTKSVLDLLQALFDAFYEKIVSWQLSVVQIRHALQGKQTLILLDDVALDRDEVEMLLQALPGCAFILASQDRRLWRKERSLALRKLSPNNASLSNPE